jgi:hypothetical protein
LESIHPLFGTGVLGVTVSRVASNPSDSSPALTARGIRRADPSGSAAGRKTDRVNARRPAVSSVSTEAPLPFPLASAQAGPTPSPASVFSLAPQLAPVAALEPAAPPAPTLSAQVDPGTGGGRKLARLVNFPAGNGPADPALSGRPGASGVQSPVPEGSAAQGDASNPPAARTAFSAAVSAGGVDAAPAAAGTAGGAQPAGGGYPANFAQLPSDSGQGQKGEKNSQDKTSLQSDIEVVEKLPARPGTRGAQIGNTMSARPSTRSFAAESTIPTAGASMRAEQSLDLGGARDSSAAAASTARSAIEAIQRIADVQAARAAANSPAVNLTFKFGEEHLAVRVELQNGQIHAQFATDSSTLRSALAGEWTAMTASNPGSHFAEPVFTSRSGQEGALSADPDGRQAYGHGGQQPEFAGTPVRSALAPAQLGVGEPPAPVSEIAWNPASHRLNAVA